MRNKGKGFPAATGNPKVKEQIVTTDKPSDKSISPNRQNVKSPSLRDLRIQNSIPAKDLVSEVRKLYPRYDKMLQSKCERPHEYGIRLVDDAMQALTDRFAPVKIYEPVPEPEPPKKKNSGHRLTCRVQCRLEDDVYAELVRQVKSDGYSTMQDWLADEIQAYLRRRSGKEKI